VENAKIQMRHFGLFSNTVRLSSIGGQRSLMSQLKSGIMKCVAILATFLKLALFLMMWQFWLLCKEIDGLVTFLELANLTTLL